MPFWKRKNNDDEYFDMPEDEWNENREQYVIDKLVREHQQRNRTDDIDEEAWQNILRKSRR